MRDREIIRNFVTALAAVSNAAADAEKDVEVEQSFSSSIKEEFYNRASEALAKLPLFKEDRMKIMMILDKVRRGEDAIPAEEGGAAEGITPLTRGTITNIYHNPTKTYYEAVILEQVQRT